MHSAIHIATVSGTMMAGRMTETKSPFLTESHDFGCANRVSSSHVGKIKSERRTFPAYPLRERRYRQPQRWDGGGSDHRMAGLLQAHEIQHPSNFSAILAAGLVQVWLIHQDPNLADSSQMIGQPPVSLQSVRRSYFPPLVADPCLQ